MRKHQVLAIGWIIMALAVVEVPGATGQPFGGDQLQTQPLSTSLLTMAL